ncbi:MAG: YheT family hydrolase [Verrucomicrobiales bacterium]
MPLVSSTYRAPLGLRGGHFSTIYPTLFRRVATVEVELERLELPDGDFLDLDWSRLGHRRLAIVGHGLEGESSAKYIRGMSLALQKRGWDTLAWNCRGCSGEPNRLLRSYHSGVSEDLGSVIDHALTHDYEQLALIGFSLGGNIVLKYLGEQGSKTHPKIKAAVAFSVPCDLTSSSLQLGEWQNSIYMSRFMDGLKEKIRHKDGAFPDTLDLSGIRKIKTFAEFDDLFTAPLNGFSDARDYWTRASSKPHLPSITIPTLMVQALNDPFLPDQCFPRKIADQSPYLYLETPPHGGHVGFVSRGPEYWSETRCAEFLTSS